MNYRDPDPALNERQARTECGISKSSFWRAIAAGRLPPPFYPTPRTPRWFRSELRAALLALRGKGR